jgi:hypothetical protein
VRRSWGHYGVLAVLAVMQCIILAACANTGRLDGETRLTPFPSIRIGETVAVIGVRQGEIRLDNANEESLRRPWIGFGLNDRLLQSFSDTGKFRLMEQDLRDRELLEGLMHVYWLERGADYSEQELSRVASQLGVKLLAYGSVSYTGASGRIIDLGPWTSHLQRLRIRVNVCLYEASRGATLCREGQGEAQQDKKGVIYEPRDDRLGFEKNAAGIATERAIALAVHDLIANIHFSQ